MKTNIFLYAFLLTTYQGLHCMQASPVASKRNLKITPLDKDRSNYLPITQDLIKTPLDTHRDKPAQISLHGRNLTLHSYNNICYAVRHSPREYYRIINYHYSTTEIVELTDAETATLNDTLSKGPAAEGEEGRKSVYLKGKTTITYEKLFCINTYIREAYDIRERYDDRVSYNIEMIIPQEQPYTIIESGEGLFAIQPKDKKAYNTAVKITDENARKKALFPFLLFNKLLHTPLDLLFNHTDQTFLVSFRAKPKSRWMLCWCKCC